MRLSDSSTQPEKKLLVSAVIQLDQMDSEPVEIERGMVVLAKWGVEAGVVAAIACDFAGGQATHIVLGHIPPTSDYPLIPLAQIEWAGDGVVRLWLSSEEIAELPLHQSR